MDPVTLAIASKRHPRRRPIAARPFRQYPLYGVLQSGKSFALGPGGFWIHNANSAIDLWDLNGFRYRTISRSQTGQSLTCVADNIREAHILAGYSGGTIAKLNPVDGGQFGTFTMPGNVAPTAIVPEGSRRGGGLNAWISSDDTALIYNVATSDGTVNYTIPYPDGVTKVRGLAYDGYGLYITTLHQPRMWCVHPRTGTVIRTYDLPCYAGYGVAYDRVSNIWYFGDELKHTIFATRLGGASLEVDGRVLDHLPLAGLFRKESVDIYGDGVSQEPHVLYLDGTFHMWFSRGLGNDQAIAHATSSDGVTWGEPTNIFGVGAGGLSTPARAPALYNDNGTLHIWFWYQGDLWHSTSADNGATWAAAAKALDKTALTDAGWPIHEGFTGFGNVGVYHNGAEYEMFIEVANTGSTWGTGRATSPDLLTWTLDGDFPAIEADSESTGVSGPFPFMSGGKHYMLIHEAPGRLPSMPALLIADPTGAYWARALGHPLLEFTDALEADQMADAMWVEARGRTYLYYSANQNTPFERFGIGVAVADMPIADLLAYALAD